MRALGHSIRVRGGPPVKYSVSVGPAVLVTWAWNRSEPLCWKEPALGMILDLASMRPRSRHNDGEMASGGVRADCAVGRQGKWTVGRRLAYAASRKPVTRVLGKKRRSMRSGTAFAVRGDFRQCCPEWMSSGTAPSKVMCGRQEL